ncbi:MAG: hypothetical protein ACE5J2_06640 [Nitrososphaerales archaeon]
MDKAQILKDFCKQILELHKTIVFAGVVDNVGILVMAEYKNGLIRSLSRQELESSILQETVRMAAGKGMETNLGKLVYTFSLYEKVKRATIRLSNPVDHMLVLLFDIKAEHESIILKKILPHLQKHGLYENAWLKRIR